MPYAKLLEVRDRGTFIPVLAVCLDTDAQRDEYEAEHYLLRSVGYQEGQRYVLLHDLNNSRCHYDPGAWSTSRTLYIAHRFIIERFWELQSGAVIDVEFLLRERSEPKLPQRLEKFSAFVRAIEERRSLEEDAE